VRSHLGKVVSPHSNRATIRESSRERKEKKKKKENEEKEPAFASAKKDLPGSKTRASRERSSLTARKVRWACGTATKRSPARGGGRPSDEKEDQRRPIVYVMDGSGLDVWRSRVSLAGRGDGSVEKRVSRQKKGGGKTRLCR